MAQPDFAAFPLVPKGNKFEDFEEGQVFEHHWGRTLTESDATLFSTLALRFTPLYFNREYARAHDHPDLVIDPLLALCTVVGLSVEDLSEAGGPFLGINQIEFHRAIHPGDTLNARSTVLSARTSEKRPQFGIVTWRTEGLDQNGELVLSYERTNLVQRRRRIEA
ncbi:MAG: MaoC family dehydratase [Myxococcota bacterium]|nr:MaoC family dehydratase [Myxococcota bacterium]